MNSETQIKEVVTEDGCLGGMDAGAWMTGDDLYKETYELVASGLSWREACAKSGAGYAAAQMRYRLRGFKSPRRVNLAPAGGRAAAAERAYLQTLTGGVARDVAKQEGISYQYMRRFCKKTGRALPRDAARQVQAQIDAIAGGQQ